MKKILFLSVCFLSRLFPCAGQEVGLDAVFKVSKQDLAGENLQPRKLDGEDDPTFLHRKIFDGEDLRIYMVAIGNRTNEFERFPIEEFIFWANGKAVVEPSEGEPFEVQSGDYFIQPKGFNGKFNFVSGDPLHLELAVTSKVRADSSVVSPISKALVIDRDIVSGASESHMKERSLIYHGVELALYLVRSSKRSFQNNSKERVFHVLNGILSLKDTQNNELLFYPGDFFVIPLGFEGEWRSIGSQAFRAFEVHQIDF